MNPDKHGGLAVDRHGDRPVYQQLYTQLRDQIRSAQPYPVGARLPSTRQLAAELGLSRNTVLLVYQRLREDGLVQTYAGGGTVVVAAPAPGEDRREAVPARVELLSERGRDLVSRWSAPRIGAAPGPAFAVGVPPIDLFPAGLWATLTSRRLRLSGSRPLLGTARGGLRALREAIAAHLTAVRGVSCDPRRLIVTRGVESGLEIVGRALLDRGAQVWCEEPGPPVIAHALRCADLVPCPVPVDAEGLDVDEARSRAPHARMAVVSPARQAPTGVPMSAERRRRLRDHAEETGMWIVEHERDAAFLIAAPPPLIADDRSNRTVYLGTFSTLLFPQLDVGYCVLPEELAEPCAQIVNAYAAAPSALTQAVLADFLDDHRSARIIARIRLAAAARRDAVHKALIRHGLGDAVLGAADSGADIALALPDPATESALADAAANASPSLTLRPLSWYSSGEPRIPGVVLGCAAVPDDAIEPSVRTFAALLAGVTG